jgi:PHD/YefM family antitoxin component YafN of YafNO toxin-antitoxin module
MDAITYTAARQQLAQTMNAVCENHAPIIVACRFHYAKRS